VSKPLSVGLAGLGTVGAGVLKLLRDNADVVEARAGRPIAVTAVSARERARDRGVSVAGLETAARRDAVSGIAHVRDRNSRPNRLEIDK
jgi:homoserine dehydrogenase